MDMIQPGDVGIGKLFWAIRDAVIVGDASTGAIVLWNPAAERLFGYSEREAVGQLLEVLVPEELKHAHRTGLSRYVATGTGPLIGAGEPVEVPALHKDGAPLTVELNLTPLTREGEQGGPYVLALVRDATVRRQVAEEREVVLAAARDYAERLEEVADLEAALTATVARELSGPLDAIQTLAQIIASESSSLDSKIAAAGEISAKAELMQRLVFDIATVTDAEQDDFLETMSAVPLEPLLAHAAEYGRLLSPDHPISERIAPELGGKQVVANAGRIGHALRNLVGNAAKHTPAGTAISIAAEQFGSHVRIAVADRGPGIAPADLPRIFEKFGRGREAVGRRVPGVGLGLYLASQIVAAHGGELVVTSQPGQGATFSFELEIAQGQTSGDATVPVTPT